MYTNKRSVYITAAIDLSLCCCQVNSAVWRASPRDVPLHCTHSSFISPFSFSGKRERLLEPTWRLYQSQRHWLAIRSRYRSEYWPQRRHSSPYNFSQPISRIISYLSCSTIACLLQASRFSLRQIRLEDSTEEIDAMESIRSICSNVDLGTGGRCFVYAQQFLDFETNKVWIAHFEVQ